MIIIYPVIFAKVLKSYSGITIWPFIIVRRPMAEIGRRRFAVLINHERIHARQQIEMLIVPFYIMYLIFYIIGRIRGKSHFEAYSGIPFEKESYAHESDITYLKKRKWLAWRKLR